MRARLLYEVEGLPVLQNKVYPSAEAAHRCPRGNLRLVQDASTGLIYNDAYRPELLVYDADYQNEQAHSAFFLDHLEEVCRLIETHFDGQPLVEVGCGKGLFLEKLAARGFSVTGLDPAYEGDDPRIRKEYFRSDSSIARGGLILRHVLEHVPDPLRFLDMLRRANGDSGKIYIEVPSLEWIRDHRAWFDLFYEHVNYFRADDFRRIFSRVHEIRSSFGGQYLSVVADLASLRIPEGPGLPFSLGEDFASSLEEQSRFLRRRKEADPDSKVYLWGGASKGVIFSVYMARAGHPVDGVVDINPAKQGKYLAVTGLPVSSPEEAMAELPDGSTLIVMNPNYLEEIRAMTKDRYGYRSV